MNLGKTHRCIDHSLVVTSDAMDERLKRVIFYVEYYDRLGRLKAKRRFLVEADRELAYQIYLDSDKKRREKQDETTT